MFHLLKSVSDSLIIKKKKKEKRKMSQVLYPLIAILTVPIKKIRTFSLMSLLSKDGRWFKNYPWFYRGICIHVYCLYRVSSNYLSVFFFTNTNLNTHEFRYSWLNFVYTLFLNQASWNIDTKFYVIVYTIRSQWTTKSDLFFI